VAGHVYSRVVFFSELALYKLPTKHVELVGLQSGHHYHLMNNSLFSPWYGWNIAHLVLSNNHSLTHSLRQTDKATLVKIYYLKTRVYNTNCNKKTNKIRWLERSNFSAEDMTSMVCHNVLIYNLHVISLYVITILML
jgi:hypothetical protein